MQGACSDSAFVTKKTCLSPVASTPSTAARNGDGTVQLTLGASVVQDQVVTAAYIKSTTTSQQITDGTTTVASFAPFSIVNLVGLAPSLTLANVKNAANTIVELTFSAAITAGTPTAADFVVQVGGLTKTVSAALSSGKVQLTLAAPVTAGQAVTVAYTKNVGQSSQNIKDPASKTVESFVATAVVNHVSRAPTLTSAVVLLATPTIIELTFSADITAGTPTNTDFVISVASTPVQGTASGALVSNKVQLTLAAAVTNGQAVTIAYTKNLGQAGQNFKDAAANAVGDIGTTTVTNTVGDLPTLTSSVVTSYTPTVVELTFSAGITAGTPTPSDFAVTVTKPGAIASSATVSTAALASGILKLTLSAAILKAEIVTVAYTQHASTTAQHIADVGSNKVATFTAAKVTNLVGVAPTLTTAAVLATTMQLTFSNAITAGNPTPADFSVVVAGSSRTVSTAALSSGLVVLTLSSGVTTGQAVTVAYTQHGSSVAQHIAEGGLKLSSSVVHGQAINHVGKAPTLLSAAVLNAAATIVELTFSADITQGAPDNQDFVVKVATQTKTTTAALANNKVQLTVAAAVTTGQAVTVAYTKDSGNPAENIKDGSSNAVDTFSETAVVNLVLTPILAAASISAATPTIVELTFSSPITVGTPTPADFVVQVAGTTKTTTAALVSGKVQLTMVAAVTAGQAVTVAYTKDSVNTAQNIKDAASAVVATFGSANVVNTVSIVPVPWHVAVNAAASSVVEISFKYPVEYTQYPGGSVPQCASDGGYCACDGHVRYGVSSTWSAYHAVRGVVFCSTTIFTDPGAGSKVCQCRPRISAQVSSGTVTPTDFTVLVAGTKATVSSGAFANGEVR